MSEVNWDTGEAELWLDNDEYAYKAMNRIVWHWNDREVANNIRALFTEIYIRPEADAVDLDAVDWEYIAEEHRDALAA